MNDKQFAVLKLYHALIKITTSQLLDVHATGKFFEDWATNKASVPTIFANVNRQLAEAGFIIELADEPGCYQITQEGERAFANRKERDNTTELEQQKLDATLLHQKLFPTEKETLMLKVNKVKSTTRVVIIACWSVAFGIFAFTKIRHKNPSVSLWSLSGLIIYSVVACVIIMAINDGIAFVVHKLMKHQMGSDGL